MHSKPISLALLMVLPFLLLGCQGPPRPVGKVQLIDAVDAQRMGYQVAWRSTLPMLADAEISYVEAFDDMVVLVEGGANLVTAVSMDDGAVLWRQVVGASTDRLHAPTRWNGLVVVNSETKLWTLDPGDGSIVRIYDLHFAVHHAPVFRLNVALFGAANGRAYGFLMPAGVLKWEHLMPAGILVRPLLIGDDVFTADAAGNYMKLRAFSGEFIWRGRTFDTISAAPTANSRNIFIPSEDQALYAVERASGDDVWIYRPGEPLLMSPYVQDPWVYQPLRGANALVALDPATGDELWRLDGLPHVIRLSSNELLLNEASRLFVVDNRTGELIRQAETARLAAVREGPGDSLVLVGADGRLVRLIP